MSTPDPPPSRELLRTEGIRKTFTGVVALDGVDFDLHEGEVHVLLGENGAGKSTLIKVLSGVHRADSGRVLRDGKPVRIHSAGDAERLGVATMHQEFNLVPHLSVAENIFLGRQPRRFGLLDRSRMNADAAEVLGRVGVDIPPDTPVRELGVARSQMVEIAKALSLRARVLIMDEPTAALTADEVEKLFDLVRRLRADGVGIVFITHHLEEIAALGDRVTVLRDGRSVGRTPASTPRDDLVRMMVGRSIEQQYPRETGTPRATSGNAEAPLLRVSGLGRAGSFSGVGFELRAGEVVGLAGLVGAGRTEVARAVFGADPYDSGTVEVQGRRLRRHDINAALAAGIGLVPEDRKGQGLLPDSSVEDNLGLVTLRRASRAGFVNLTGQQESASRIAGRLNVRMSGLGQRMGTLSGGNQQKVVIGKWLLAQSRVLILDEPTRGIDVGAKVEIYELINELTASGHAVLMISSDLPEVLGMSDRVLVMAQGRIAGELAAREATQDAVMRLAVGTAHEQGTPASKTKDKEGLRGH
ncbi:sugar ABC transporter ATP-binding protein [Streptomyces abyssalis]|uniref:Sugar ABC transporter ATP-binding protein n=1 Tax=Streptomyces abyssalis TaxID=933944 RepID=A0A1E7JJK3_9ACTN|nr:sugar ABC transporter ATP-binding protein [Streptomyces abyssalis]OEU87295.1 sugar ABC transporter ATP-binding protein [Streptomyces abyssalis]OEU87827.1 sugar ABC transporter ATP-binding protein [Streptomyces abyssalis]OEV29137.1 sugar ABC transporter ATP-binding protein [Streptomyces nanshensis]